VYHYFYNWQVESEAVLAESARVPVVAEVTNGVVLNIRALLEGPYVVNNGAMHDSLRVAGLIPLNEPYAALGMPQVGAGGETLGAAALAVTGDDAVVDWVRIELRRASDPTVVEAVQSGIITRTGQVLAANRSPIRFGILATNYYVAIRHRNHLAMMTATPVALSASSPLIDFTLPSTLLYGTTAGKIMGGKQVLWAGDVIRDGVILYTGASNDRDRILNVIGGVIPTNVVNGYNAADVNLDGRVLYTGAKNDRDIILTNIGGAVPTNSLLQQLP
jgi:hypothetical protein